MAPAAQESVWKELIPQSQGSSAPVSTQQVLKKPVSQSQGSTKDSKEAVSEEPVPQSQGSTPDSKDAVSEKPVSQSQGSTPDSKEAVSEKPVPQSQGSTPDSKEAVSKEPVPQSQGSSAPVSRPPPQLTCAQWFQRHQESAQLLAGEWCKQPSNDSFHGGPIGRSLEYCMEEWCYFHWLDKHCVSVKDCPRPGLDPGHDVIWHRLGRVNQKNMLMARLMYQWSFFAAKHKLVWALISGSILGPLRSKSQIPWDNDVDLWIDPFVNGGWKTVYDHFHQEWTDDAILHAETNRLYLRDLNSCRFPQGGNSSHIFYGFAIDTFHCVFGIRNEMKWATQHLASYKLGGRRCFRLPIKQYSISGSDDYGKTMPGWVFTPRMLALKYGNRYMDLHTHEPKAMGNNFTTDQGCFHSQNFWKNFDVCRLRVSNLSSGKQRLHRTAAWQSTACHNVSPRKVWKGEAFVVEQFDALDGAP